MEDYQTMLQEYRNGISALQDRIDELTETIRRQPEEAANQLVERRYRLYKMVWEMQRDIADLTEYINSVEQRETAGRAQKPKSLCRRKVS